MERASIPVSSLGVGLLLAVALSSSSGAQATRRAVPVAASGGSEIVSSHTLSPDGAWVGFISDRVSAGTYELFGAPLDRSTPAVKLSGTLAAGGDVQTYPYLAISATNRVVYVARQAKDELYSVPVDGSAPPVKLNGTLVSGGNVSQFELDALGTRVIYRADQQVDNRVELYSVPIDGSLAPVKLSPTGSERVVADRISPDGSRVVYATGPTGTRQVWSQPIDASGPAVLLGQASLAFHPLIAEEDALRPRFTPDGSRLLFQELLLNGAASRLLSVPVDGSAAAIRLHPLPYYLGSSMTPDGSRVVYLDLDRELYSVAPTGGARLRLTDEPATLGQVDLSGFDQTGLTGFGRLVISTALSADGDHALLGVRDNPQLNIASRLYTVPVDGSQEPRLVVGPLPPPLHITGIAPGSGRVVYTVLNASGATPELYSAPLDGSAPPTRLGKRLLTLNLVPFFALAPDGSRVVFCGETDAGGQRGLFVSPIDGSAPSVLLEALASTASVEALSISADSLHAILRRSQSAGGALQIVGAPLDGSSAASPY